MTGPNSAEIDAGTPCPACGHRWPHDDRWGCLAELGDSGSGSVADAAFCKCRCTGQMRYFLDGIEVSEDTARSVESEGQAHVTMGGSAVVPERFRQPGETRDEWLRPWMALETTPTTPGGSDA